MLSRLQMSKHSLCSRLAQIWCRHHPLHLLTGKLVYIVKMDTCFMLTFPLPFCPSKPVYNYYFSYTQTQTYLFISFFFFFLSSTGASLNDFWQTYPVVQRHLKINCPFPSISSWLLLNSNHISPPLSWAPLPKVEPVTHHKRKERVR